MRDHEYNMQDYLRTYDTFQWERPEKYNFARDVIDRWDPAMPAMLWVDDGGAEITRTFGEISEASRRLCNVLAEAGVRTGDTVVVMLPRVIPWWETFTATLRMGRGDLSRHRTALRKRPGIPDQRRGGHLRGDRQRQCGQGGCSA